MSSPANPGAKGLTSIIVLPVYWVSFTPATAHPFDQKLISFPQFKMIFFKVLMIISIEDFCARYSSQNTRKLTGNKDNQCWLKKTDMKTFFCVFLHDFFCRYWIWFFLHPPHQKETFLSRKFFIFEQNKRIRHNKSVKQNTIQIFKKIYD